MWGIDAYARKEIAGLNSSSKNFRFSEFSLIFRIANFHSWVIDNVLCLICPLQQYIHTRSHPRSATREISISDNIIWPFPASSPYARIMLADRAKVLVRQREISEYADNYFIICSVIESLALVWGRQFQLHGEKTHFLTWAVPDKI